MSISSLLLPIETEMSTSCVRAPPTATKHTNSKGFKESWRGGATTQQLAKLANQKGGGAENRKLAPAYKLGALYVAYISVFTYHSLLCFLSFNLFTVSLNLLFVD